MAFPNAAARVAEVTCCGRSGRLWRGLAGWARTACPRTAGSLAVDQIAHAYQRTSKIVKQSGPGACSRAVAGDEHIVDPRDAQLWQQSPCGSPEATAGPVADNRVANLFGGGEAETRWPIGRASAGFNHQLRAASPHALAYEKEFLAGLEPA